MKKRIEYLDQLRIIAILDVILLHCMAIFRYKYFLKDSLSFFGMTFLDGFTRVGIPIFFMLTGALMLPKKEEPYKEFFFKRVWKLIVAYIFFSLIYFIYKGNTNVFEFVRQVTSYRTYYHLWFMPAMIVIYCLIPFLQKGIKGFTKQDLKKMIITIFILGNGFIAVGALTKLLGYSLMSSFALPNLFIYMNYVFLGYYLSKYEDTISKKLMILSILSMMAIPFASVWISKTEILDTFLDAISPFVIAPSILVFLWFKKGNFHFPEWITKQANNIFYVYLIHALPLAILEKKMSSMIQVKGFVKDIFLCLGLWIIVSVLSFILAACWVKLKEWVKKHLETISNVLLIILVCVLGLFITGVIICIRLNPYQFIKMNVLATILCMVAIVGIGYLLYHFREKLWKRKQDMIAMVMVMIAMQVLVAYLFAVKPSWDFGRIYENAISFAKSAHPAFGNPYLYVCSNNIMISVIWDILFKGLYWIGIKRAFLPFSILVNMAMIDVSIVYLYKLCKRMQEDVSKPFLVFVVLFSPLLFYIPIFYTDTFTLPFIVIPLYYLYKYFFINQKLRYIIISGLLIGFGGMIKPTVLIPFLAIFIFVAIKKEYQKNSLGMLGILIGCVILPLLGQRIFIHHFFDQQALDLYQIPMSHYILIGLEGNGGYEENSFKRINQVLGQSERNKLAIQGIKDRFQELKEKKEIISFYFKKLNYTWTDGTFFAGGKLGRKPLHAEYTQYVYSEEDADWFYWAISNAEWILVLGCMLLGLMRRKKLPKQLQDFQAILMISMAGIILFLLIWETRSRYLVNMIPIFLLMAYLGLVSFQKAKER